MKVKTKLKRILALVLAMSMVFALAACGSSSDSTEEETEEEATTSEETEEDTEDSEETEEAEETESEEEETEDEDAEATETSSEEPVYGGDVTCIALSNGITAYFDPSGMADSVTYALWLEGLWSFDVSSGYEAYSDNVPSSALKGQIAESWEWDEDTATLTVTLRDDVYFQTLDEEYDYYGGRQLVADDVKWSYDRLVGQGEFEETGAIETEAGWESLLSPLLEATTVIDDYTVAFTLTSGDEVTLSSFMTQFVKIGGPEWDDLTEEQQSDYHYACGTGPFKLELLEAGVQVVLVKNENYYDTDPRYPDEEYVLPYLDQINFVVISDSTNLVTQFTSSQLDIISGSTLSDSQEQMIADSGVDYYTLTYTTTSPSYLACRCDTEFFDDVNVRIAMQLAIDLDTIHTDYLGMDGEVQLSGLWNPYTTEWSTVDEWDDELIAEYDYDPERAIELLEEAGYADGYEIDVAIDTDMDTDLWQLCVEYWKAIGVTVNLDMYQTYMEVKTIGTDDTLEESTGSTGAGAVGSITAAQNQTIDGGWAASLWHGNEEYMSLMDDLIAATTLDEQAEIAREMDLIYAEEHWTINLCGMQDTTGFYASRIHLCENGTVSSGKTAAVMYATCWVDE